MKGLKHEADIAVAGGRQLFIAERGDIPPVQKILTGAGPVEQAEQIEQGGFARAGRSHDGNIVTIGKIEIDIIEGVNGLIADLKVTVNIAQFDHRLFRFYPDAVFQPVTLYRNDDAIAFLQTG